MNLQIWLTRLYFHIRHRTHQMIGGKVLLNWAMFTAPRHPIMLELMRNVVDVIRSEFLRAPVVWMLSQDPRWKVVHCATGPQILTATVLEMMLTRAINDSSLRVAGKDFHEYGGEFKDDGKHVVDRSASHYMVRRVLSLLSPGAPRRVLLPLPPSSTPTPPPILLVSLFLSSYPFSLLKLFVQCCCRRWS